MVKQYPVIITVRDRITYLKKLLLWLENAGQHEIWLCDNASTYPPLVEFLKTNNFSPFIGEFFGQSKLSINCLGCRKTSSTFEEYNTINLTVPKETKSVCDLFVKYLGNILQADPSNLYFCDTPAAVT